MPLAELNVLLPCHSLDDFPTYYTDEAAEGILAAWSALWHPALIAAAGKLPQWLRSDDPPEQLAGRLLAVPKVVQDDMPGMFFSQAEHEGARLICGLHRREEIVAAALEELRRDNAAGADQQASRERQRPEEPEKIDPNLADDFLALGFCYLQTEVLTRRMRYMSNLDESLFERSTLAAAKAAAAGNTEDAKTQLTTAFNALLEARGYFYPVDAYFIDITLTGPTTIGASLRDELASGVPLNVLLSAATLQQMALEEPTTLSALRAALDAGVVGLIGGEFNEIELPLMPHESIRSQLILAGTVYDRLLGRRPTVFGRYCYGLTSALPQILRECGFTGAVHITFDGAGRFPQSERVKTAWAGLDGSSIDALGRAPLDANRPETFLTLPETLGDTMDHDFVATAVFAHWPGYASPFYGDLRRMAKYAAVLGKFTTVENYFQETESSGAFSKFAPDQYRSPYLQQAVNDGVADPVSSPSEFRRRHAKSQAAETLTTMVGVLRGSLPAVSVPSLEETQRDGLSIDAAKRAEFDRCVESASVEAVREFANSLPRQNVSAQSGYLVVNPLNFARRMGIELPELTALPAIGGHVVAADDAGGTKRAVIEVPPLGFAWITACQAKAEHATSRRNRPPIIAVENNILRNEFCEVTIHPETGGIQSVRDFHSRGNRLSQQLAIRLPAAKPSIGYWHRGDEATYTQMVAESIAVEQSDSVYGRIVSRGRLVDSEGKPLAQFVQTTSLWHGCRVIELDIEITSLAAELQADPWNSYVAGRFAWSDSTAQLRRSVHGCSVATEARRLEAPEFVEIANDRTRTAILTGGLPYHRRSGERMLHCVLKTRGESAIQFRLGIGIDVPHVWRAAQEMLLPPSVLFQHAAPPISGPTGWLFHVDAPNVAATHWSPLAEQCSPLAPREAGRAAGFCVRLLETEGRRGTVRLRCFRPPSTAQRMDVAGKQQSELTIDSDAIVAEIGPYEWLQIEARW